MHLFLFRPFCAFSEPDLDCTDGWAMYQFLGMLTMVGYRRVEMNALMLGALLVVYYLWALGIPGPELLLNFLLGTGYGALILFLTPNAPHTIARHPLRSPTDAISYLIVLGVCALAFADIDERIDEGNARYGVVGTFIFVMLCLLLLIFILFHMNGNERAPESVKAAFWCQWEMVVATTFVIMLIALLGDFGGYVKALVTLPLAPLVIYARSALK